MAFLSEVWIACRPFVQVYCSHCLFLRDPEPSRSANPPWCRPKFERDPTQSHHLRVEMENFSGMDPVKCKREAALTKTHRPTVPKPLLFPCYHLTDGEIQRLNSYLSDIESKRYSTSTGRHEPNVFRRSRPTAPDEELSELSDEEVYCDKSADPRISTRLRTVKQKKIKDLYNGDKVYWMSDGVRGRALIINIRSIRKDSGLQRRDGSGVDYDNLSRLFKDLEFDIVKTSLELTDLTAQEVYDEIKEETRQEVHKSLGMFVFVIMSLGKRGDILLDCHGQPIDLVKVRDLLSAANFPAMKGKPKLLIVQACSGERFDYGDGAELAEVPGLPSTTPLPSGAPSTSTEPSAIPSTDPSTLPSAGTGSASTVIQPPTSLNSEDFFIMKPSAESYTAIRSLTHGSWFIRILVMTFYNHAHSRDVESLFKIIQNRVSNITRKRIKTTSGLGGNVPTSICTFTGYRKLYLFPGFRVRK